MNYFTRLNLIKDSFQKLAGTIGLLGLLLMGSLSFGQITLGTSPYTQNFDAIGSGLPTGWNIYTGATSTSLGSAATLTTAATSWAVGTGQFANFASTTSTVANGGILLTSSSSATNQSNSTNRALGLQQTASYANPGGAFAIRLTNTTGLSAFALSFSMQQGGIIAGRTSTWRVDYGFGTTPTSFTTATTSPATVTTTAGTWGSTTVTVNFGSALNNNSQNVWIRIWPPAAATGSGNSPANGIDDFNLTYTSTPTFTSTSGGGLWNATGSWVGGVVPSAGATVNIVGPITIDNTTGAISNTGTININDNGTLLCGYTSGASLTGAGTVNVNGTGILDIEQGGWPGTTNTYNYGNVTAGTGTLKFNNSSGSYGVNNTDTWFPATITNVNVAGAGGITLNSAHVISGLFQSSATVTTPGNITANGTLQLNSGYNWSGTGNPIYGSASLLKYNSGGSPGRAAEWTATSGTIGTTAGYPNNVQVSNNTTLNFANGGTSTYKANGTLTVDSGSSLYQNYSGGNAGLAVVSDVIINGNITLGTSTGDLYVGGNLTVGASANFSTNGRAVFFNGAAAQTITKTGAGTVAFDYFIIDKSAGNVVLSASPATDVTVNANSGNVLQLINTGSLDLNGRSMAFNNSGGGIYVNGTRTINSTVAGGSLAFNQYKFVANNSGTGSLILAANVVVNLNANGNVDFGKSGATYITTLSGTLSLNSTTSCFVNTNPPIYGSASLLKYNSTGTYSRSAEWSTTSGAGYPNDIQVTNTTTLDIPNTGGAFTTNLALARNLTIDSGSALYMDYGAGIASGSLTVGGNVTNAGSLSLGDGSGGDLSLAGNWNNSGTFTPNGRLVTFTGATPTLTGNTTFAYLTLNCTTGLTLQVSSPVTVTQTLTFTNGKLTIGANNLTIASTGSISGTDTSKYVVAASTGQLKRTVGASATLFPVGNTAYNPITFNNSGTSDVYGIRVVNTAPAGANSTKTITRQWITTEAVAGGSNLSVVAQYNTGETGSGFATATDNFIGQYNGTSWIQAPATQTGSNPFVVSSNSNLSPVDMTTGTQYFAIGRDNGFLVVPTKYVVTAITPASPTAGSGFSVTVTAQDNYGNNVVLSSNSSFSLTSNGNAGAISGTTTGTINSGSSSVVVTGIILANAGTGVTITATNASGLSLTAGTSATFAVLAPASQLAFIGVPGTGNVGVNLTSFTVEARRPDGSVDNTYTNNITITKGSGTGILSGTLTVSATAGVATFAAAQFDTADTFTLSATSGSLTSAISGNIIITLAPIALAGWDFFTVTSGSPPATFAATTFNSNLISTSGANNITRGAAATASGANSSFRTAGFQNNGISTSNTDYFQTTLTTANGYTLNLNSINAIYNGTTTFYASPGVTSQYAYSLDGINFTLIGSPVTSTTILSQVSVSTAGIAALQNVPSGTTVYIRYYASGQTTTGGWGYYSGTSGSEGLGYTGNIFCVQPIAYNVTGGNNSICTGSSGVVIGLSNSQRGVSYQLKNGVTNVGSPVAGTGTAISFGSHTDAGTYTVVASNTNGTCNYTLNMTGNAIVSINPLPTAAIGGTTSVCQNAAAPQIAFTGANGTAPYTFTYTLNGSNQTISTVSGNSVTLSAPTTSAGTFTYALVSVADAHCSQNQSGSAVVTVIASPTASVISGSAAICIGSTTNLQVAITGGASPYTVVYSGGTLNSYTSGTDIPVSPTSTTSYTITSVTDANGCAGTGNSGSANVTLDSTTSTDGGISWSNGTPSASKSVIFDGATANIATDIAACSLRLTNNAVVNIASDLNVTLSGAVKVDSGSTFTLNNNSNLMQTGTNYTNTGNIIVKRNSSAIKRLDYTLWSSPVTGQGLYAFSPFTFANRFYTYLTATNVYNNAALGMSVTGLNSDGVNGTDSNNVPFATGKGYLIRTPWDHPTAPAVWGGTFTGVPHNGDLSVNVSTDGEPTIGFGYNAVGNPYPSRINVHNFIDGNANISGTLYFWRKTNDNSSNSYATLTKTAYVANGATGGDTGTGFFNDGEQQNWVINIGQGFFVRATGGTSINFTNSMRRSSNGNQFFKASQISSSPENNGLYWLNLTTETGTYSQMAVGYSSEGTLGVDRGIDGENINRDFYLTSLIGTGEYSIQGRPDFQSSDVVPLSYKAASAGNYTISIDHTAGAFNGTSQSIYLKDNLTSTVHDLRTGAYSFTTDAGTFTNRFEVVYETQLGVGNPTLTENNVIIYKSNNDFVIKTGNILMATVKVFDIRGRLIQEKKEINASQTSITGGLSNEVLLVQITSEDGAVVTKKVIR